MNNTTSKIEIMLSETSKLKNSYTAKEISELCNVSEKTIRRKRDNLLELGLNTRWFNVNKKPQRYSYEFLGEFLSEKLMEILRSHHQLENNIRALRQKDSLASHFALLDWNYFITISPKESLPKSSCFDKMNKFYQNLEKNYPHKNLRIFFTTEDFANRKGNHNHMALLADVDKSNIQNLLVSEFNNVIIDIQHYNNNLAGIHYISKQGIKGIDWDILGTCLANDGNYISMIKSISAHKI